MARARSTDPAESHEAAAIAEKELPARMQLCLGLYIDARRIGGPRDDKSLMNLEMAALACGITSEELERHQVIASTMKSWEHVASDLKARKYIKQVGSVGVGRSSRGSFKITKAGREAFRIGVHTQQPS